MSANFPPSLRFRVKDRSDSPAAGGKVYCFVSGTDDTPAPTYKDTAMTVENDHPIILDARGECDLKLDNTLHYKIVCYDIGGNLISTEPDVQSIASSIFGAGGLQSAYENGSYIRTSTDNPVTITKGVPYQDNKIDSDGTVAQFYGQISERRVSNTKVLNSDSANNTGGKISFHVEHLRADYYEDAVNITDITDTKRILTETNSKQTYSKVDDLTLSYKDIIEVSDKTTTDTFNIKREAFIRNASNTNRIDILEQESLNGYRKNVNYEYDGQQNDDELYQTIGGTSRTRTISSPTSGSEISESQSSTSELKSTVIDSATHISGKSISQYNTSISNIESVENKSTSEKSIDTNTMQSTSIAREQEVVGGAKKVKSITKTAATETLTSPDGKQSFQSSADNSEARLTMNNDGETKVNITSNTNPDGSLLAEGVYATSGAIGSVTKTITASAGENVFNIDGVNGQNFTCVPNLTTAGQVLVIPNGYVKSGFDYTIEIDLRSTPNLPDSFYFPSGMFVGNPPAPEAKQYLFSIHKTDTTSYVRDITSITNNDVERRRVYNGTGSIIPNGTVLNITGGIAEGTGFVGTVELADAISPAKLTDLVISTQEMAIGGYGEAIKIGDLNDLNTSSFSNGDIIYLSESTPGLITNVKPTIVGRYVCQIGIVYKVNATTGIIAACIKPPKVIGFTGSGSFTNFTYIDGTLIAVS